MEVSVIICNFAHGLACHNMVNQITIEGYKSFRAQTIKLDGLNVLIGSNGAGKSNFLSFFELLGNAFEQRLGAYVATTGGVDKLLFQGRKTTEKITATLIMSHNSYGLTLQEADGKLIVENERLGYYNDIVTITEYSPEATIKTYSGMSRGNYIKDYLSHIRKFHFHDTGRRSPFATECHVRNDAYTLYSHGENLSPILYRMQQERPIAYQRIVKVIQSVAPYFLDFYFQASEAETLRLQWRDKYSEMIYGPNDLSDGTIRFIALATLFLQPILPSVVIIDEPELGLHPVAIQKLAGLMKSAAARGCQIIAATQSADLISNFEPEQILTTNLKDGQTLVERLNGEELSHWLRDYSLGDLWKQSIVKGGQPQ